MLEIGTEELPSAVLPQALQDLATLGQRLFADCRLEYESLRTVGTPRRLTLLVKGVQTQQASLTQEILGPPVSAALDASGQPTQAAYSHPYPGGGSPWRERNDSEWGGDW